MPSFVLSLKICFLTELYGHLFRIVHLPKLISRKLKAPVTSFLSRQTTKIATMESDLELTGTARTTKKRFSKVISFIVKCLKY